MAKDLPYFKFFCSEWNDGDITLETYKIQGLFINICSYYWSKECNVSFDKLIKRFKFSEEIDVLFAEKLIKRKGNYVSISFLDEQKEERDLISKKNSLAGKKSAEKRRLNKEIQRKSNENPTSVEITFNEKSTIKRREEKKRKYIPDLEVFMVYLKDYLKEEPERYSKVRQRMIDTYNAWFENDWKDGNDKNIKNWKTKAIMQLRYIKWIHTKKYTT